MANSQNTSEEEKRNAAKARYRARYAANPEYYRARALAWHYKNRERSNAKSAEWRAKNPEKVAEANRKSYAENLDHHRERWAEWAAKNKTARAEYMRGWYQANPDKHAEYNSNRRKSPSFRLDNAIRCRIWAEITKGSKRGRRTRDLLPFSTDELMLHLERQFKRGMSWENYGEWHIDHVLPLSSFTYTTPDDPEFRAAWALTNLRPLWAGHNLSKGAKRLNLL